jgi:hypothetical protein
MITVPNIHTSKKSCPIYQIRVKTWHENHIKRQLASVDMQQKKKRAVLTATAMMWRAGSLLVNAALLARHA